MRIVEVMIGIFLMVILVPIFVVIMQHIKTDIFSGLPNMSSWELALPAALVLSLITVGVLHIILKAMGRGQ